MCFKEILSLAYINYQAHETEDHRKQKRKPPETLRFSWKEKLCYIF